MRYGSRTVSGRTGSLRISPLKNLDRISRARADVAETEAASGSIARMDRAQRRIIIQTLRNSPNSSRSPRDSPKRPPSMARRESASDASSVATATTEMTLFRAPGEKDPRKAIKFRLSYTAPRPKHRATSMIDSFPVFSLLAPAFS